MTAATHVGRRALVPLKFQAKTPILFFLFFCLRAVRGPSIDAIDVLATKTKIFSAIVIMLEVNESEH